MTLSSPLSFALLVANRTALPDLRAKNRSTRRARRVSVHEVITENRNPQCDLAADAWLSADAHSDKRGVGLIRQLVVAHAVGVHDVSTEEEQIQPMRGLRDWLVAYWAGCLGYTQRIRRRSL